MFDKSMNTRQTFRKFGLRLIVVVVVFFCIKLAVDPEYGRMTVTDVFYFITAFIFFMSIWELNDYLIKRHLQKNQPHSLDWAAGLEILAETLAFALPFIALVYYVAIFHFADPLGISNVDPWLEFRADFLRAGLLTVTTVVFNLFYFAGKVRKKLELKLAEVQKEMLATQYSSLKSQISPHFLFNSLNTLAALMYEDRDLASDFVTRLSSCYRYILDNQAADLIRLDKELAFLDSFIFMMEVRHQAAVQISTEINVNAKAYLIPTLSLQMLLENALKHNYYSLEQPLTIRIRATNRKLCLENTLRKRREPQPSTQVGLDNIRKRYSFYTQEPVTVTETDACFRVSIPLLANDVKQLSLSP